MDIKSLYTLVAAADCGSFAEAGARLDLSASSVSLQIRALEEETGRVLFDRTTRPPTLSEDGRNLVAQARDLLSHWESLSDSLRRDAGGGLLKLGAVHTTVAGAVPVALRRLRDDAPALGIELATGLTHELEAKVARRMVDCALVTEPEALDPNLAGFPVAEEPLVVIAPASVEERTDQELLSRHPYVRFNRRARVAQMIDAELMRRGISVSWRMEIDTLDAVMSLVRNGLGVSIVPLDAGGRAFSGDIVSAPFGTPSLKRRLSVIMRRDCAKAHLVDMLVSRLRDVYGTGELGQDE